MAVFFKIGLIDGHSFVNSIVYEILEVIISIDIASLSDDDILNFRINLNLNFIKALIRF